MTTRGEEAGDARAACAWASGVVHRCQRNLDHGGNRAWWAEQLEHSAKLFEAAAAILRMQVAAMNFRAMTAEEPEPERPICGICGGPRCDCA